MKDKSPRIKFVILTAHLLTKIKTLCYTLLFGNENMNDSENTHIFKATIEYILSTESLTFLYLSKSNKSFNLYNSLRLE